MAYNILAGGTCLEDIELLRKNPAMINVDGTISETYGHASRAALGNQATLDNEVIIHCDCDSLILAVGYAPDRSLYEEIRLQMPNTYVLGDARRVANIMYAIWDAFEVANGL